MLITNKIINKNYIYVYFLSIFIFFIMAFLFGGVVQSTCHWDCHWYSYIASNGYGKYSHLYHNSGMADWCFFPLYPVVIRIFSELFRFSVQVSGLIINNVMLFFIPYLIIKYVNSRKYNLDRNIILLFSFFSIFSLWYRIQYTECIYAIILMCSLYCFQNKKIYHLMFFIFILSLCRPTGFFVGIILSFFLMKEEGFENIIRKKYDFMRYLLISLVGFSAIGLYGLYLYHLTGDGLAFSHAQTAWGREFHIPVVIMWESLKHIHHMHLVISFFIDIFIILYGYKRKYFLESTILASTFMMASSSSLMSIHRFIFGCPLTIIIISDFVKKYVYKIKYVYIFCFVSFILSSIFWFLGTKYLF